MYPSGTLISVKSRSFWCNQFGNFLSKISCWSLTAQKEDLKINISALFVRISSSLRTCTPPQYDNVLFSIKYRYRANNFYPIFAWCWRMGLKLWFDFLGLKLFQCLDYLFFWILKGIAAFCLRSKCLFKYELVDDIHAVLIHLGQQLNIYGGT